MTHKLFNGERGGHFKANPGSSFNLAIKDLISCDDYEREWDVVLAKYDYAQNLVIHKREIFDCVKRAKTAELTREIRKKVTEQPLRIWQRKLVNFLLSTDAQSNRKIWWFHESIGNIGKSFLCNYLAVAHDFITVDKGKYADMVESIWQNYSITAAKRRAFCFDFARDQKAGDRSTWGAVPALIEKLSNDAPIQRAKYTSDSMWFGPNKPVIVVFANSPPPASEDALFSQDRLEDSTFNLRSVVFCNRFQICWRTDTELETTEIQEGETSKEGSDIVELE